MIGVFSDSHGDLEAFDAAYELLRSKGARRFIFAGGRYADLDQWAQHRRDGEAELERVKGRFVRVLEKGGPAYLDGSVPRKAVDLLGDALCQVVHDKNDLTRDDLLNASVFIHGRGAEPGVVQIGPRYFITPGMLSGVAGRACALLQVVDRNVLVSAFGLDGEVLLDGQVLCLDRRTKLSVK